MVKRYFIYTLYILPVIFGLLFVFFIYFELQGNYLQPTDSTFYFSEIEATKNFHRFWQVNDYGNRSMSELVNFYSNPIGFVLLTNGISAIQTRLIMYFLIITLSFYSSWFVFYKLSNHIEGDNGLVASCVAAFSYTFGFQMVLFLSGGLAISLAFLLISFPFIFYFFVSGVIKPLKYFELILLGIIVGLNYNNFHFLLPIVLVFSITYLLFTKVGFLKRIVNIFVIMFTSLFSGFTFLYTYYLIIISADADSIEKALDRLLFSSVGIIGYFRLFFNWTINKNWDGVNVFASFDYYNNSLIVFLIFVVWLLIFYYWYKSKNTSRTVYSSLMLVVFLSIFIAKGNQPPLSGIAMMLYDYVPFWGIFRTPDTKFGLPVALTFSAFIFLTYNYSNKFVKLLIILFVVFYSFGFFYTPQFLGVQPRSKVVNIPDEYATVANIVNTSSSGYVLLVPGISIGNFVHPEGLSFLGRDILSAYITRPVIRTEDSRFFTNSKYAINTLINNSATSDFGKMHIGTIVLRNDIEEAGSIVPSIEYSYNPNLDKVYSSQSFEIYNVDENTLNDFITVVSAETNEDIPFKITHQDNSQIDLLIEKQDDKDINIVMFNNYSFLWRGYDDSGAELQHDKFQEHSNLWFLQNNPDNAIEKISLVMILQKRFDILFKLNVVSLITLFSIIIYLWKNNK